MKIINIIILIFLTAFMAGCTSVKHVFSDISTPEKKDFPSKIIEEKKEKTIQYEDRIAKYELSKKEKEFLEILKTDKYASLCSLQNEFIDLMYMPDSQTKSELIKDMFVSYTENLANSCIDQISFKETLKTNKYKKRKQYYETYNTKIDKEKLLTKFNNENTSVVDVLNSYAPKNPVFFKLIEKLDTVNLSESKYNKLRLNIERLKLTKDYRSENFIKLNIPSHNFTLFENGQVERTFGTVVGEKEHQTPILSSKLSYFIINPTWNIPDSIAKSTIIPNALKDKNYLKRKNIVIRKNYKLDSKKFAFKDVKWKKYLKKNVKYIPYKFIQLPSRTNGMGKVKYMFQNDYAVYMHDTIGTWRFKDNREKIRFASHGCVRLEHPISLMKHLTTNYTPKSYKKLRKTYLKGDIDTVSLSQKLPLHITYLTANVDEKGKLKFYKDVYEYDKIQRLNFIPHKNALELASLEKDFNSNI